MERQAHTEGEDIVQYVHNCHKPVHENPGASLENIRILADCNKHLITCMISHIEQQTDRAHIQFLLEKLRILRECNVTLSQCRISVLESLGRGS
jgi:predicted transcriptional regulator